MIDWILAHPPTFYLSHCLKFIFSFHHPINIRIIFLIIMNLVCPFFFVFSTKISYDFLSFVILSTPISFNAMIDLFSYPMIYTIVICNLSPYILFLFVQKIYFRILSEFSTYLVKTQLLQPLKSIKLHYFIIPSIV